MPSARSSRRSFLQHAAAGLATAALHRPAWAASVSAGTAPLMAYVGSYSSPAIDTPPGKFDVPPGNGRGIYLFHVDRKSGALEPKGVFSHAVSPVSLVINPAGTRMYSTNATAQIGDGSDAGAVSTFAIDRTDGALTLLGNVSSGGKGPTHLSLHPSGRFAFVANYPGGSVAVLPVLADGKLGPPTDVKKASGTVGPKRATSAPPGSFAISGHDFPHAHMIEPDRSGRFVVSADLGLDRLFLWRFDERAAALVPNDPPSIALPPGDGPRHFAFHPNGRWFYSLQEEGSNLALYDYDANAGRLAHRQTISTLPAGFAGTNFTSEIMVSSDGRFVYVANRLHDSIAFFAIGADGTLQPAGEEWTRGDYPRSFNFDPTATFLYSCNQRSDVVTAFRVDRASGRLAFTGHYTPVGNPSCIVFLDLRT